MIIHGKEWLVDDALSGRWPLYTRGNVGEVFPDVVTPLNWTLLGGAVEESDSRHQDRDHHDPARRRGAAYFHVPSSSRSVATNPIPGGKLRRGH